MKIGLILEWNFTEPGGVQQHVKDLSLKLKDFGHDVRVILKKRKVENPPVSSFYLDAIFPYPRILFPPHIGDILRILKRERFDIVHIHHIFTPISIAGGIACVHTKTPFLYTNHTLPLFYRKVWILKILPFQKVILNRADRIISVSRCADEIISLYVKDKQKREVIPNGVDTDVFKPLRIKRKGKPIILFVGRLVERKGIDILIRAYSNLKIPAELWIIGEGRDEERYRRLAESLNINVRFLGHVSNSRLPYYYNLSTVVVVPSKERESFGIVAVEGMACGKPVIVSDVGGLPEIVEDGVDGIIFKNGNFYELGERIHQVITDSKLAGWLGKNARKKVCRLYSWDVVAERIVGIYMDILSIRG